MKALGHGANVVEMAMVYGKEKEKIIDFSSNINPFVSEALNDHLPKALEAAKSYPDIHYTRLRESIAEYLYCQKDEVIVGNGATEVMYLLMKALGPLRLGIMNPTFSEYERSACLSGLTIVDLKLCEEEGFKVRIEEIEEQLERFDALFICNPNNPTGNVQDLKRLASSLEAADKWLIVDETFMEFVQDEASVSLVPLIKAYKKLIVIKAVTKFFGLPGLRLGYGVTTHKELLETMYEYKEPWTVNSFADELTQILLKDRDYREKSKAYYQKERSRMISGLSQIKHMTVYETATNFILIKLDEMKSSDLKQQLFIEENILIREASNFKGLDESYIRVAIKLPEQNDLLISSLKRIVGSRK